MGRARDYYCLRSTLCPDGVMEIMYTILTVRTYVSYKAHAWPAIADYHV